MALNITISYLYGGPDVNYSTTGDDSSLDYWMHMFYTRGWADVIHASTGRHHLITYHSVQKATLT